MGYCCTPWFKCEVCKEELPIHMIEECCNKQVCEKCAKECREKGEEAVNS